MQNQTPCNAAQIALAEKVANYVTHVGSLTKETPMAEYHKANCLGLQLAMLLPEHLYRKMVKIIVSPTNEENFLTFTIEVRKHLLGDQAGNLGSGEIAVSGPGIGEKPTA